MATIKKCENQEEITIFKNLLKENFTFSEKTVQRATIGKKDNLTYIISPNRYKFYTEGNMKVYVVSGNGFIKWARGEIKFNAFDLFEIENAKEFEFNGNCVIISQN